MSLTKIVEKEEVIPIGDRKPYQTKPEYMKEEIEGGKSAKQYGLFCEQYLEKPVISGDYKMAITPTACTIQGIPVIDDF